MRLPKTCLKPDVSLIFLLPIVMFFSCRTAEPGGSVVVKPRYHRTWYKNHVYKKKWHIGRIKFEPEKQGVKKVKMKG